MGVSQWLTFASCQLYLLSRAVVTAVFHNVFGPADATATHCLLLSEIQTGFTLLVPAYLGSPRKGPLNGCVCVYVCYQLT